MAVKKTYTHDAAHHCSTVTVAVSCVVDGRAVLLERKVKTGAGFAERAAVAQRKLQEKAMKLTK